MNNETNFLRYAAEDSSLFRVIGKTMTDCALLEAQAKKTGDKANAARARYYGSRLMSALIKEDSPERFLALSASFYGHVPELK